MNFQVGQGILGKTGFKDGVMAKYKRTFLVVSVQSDYIEVLNVSSTAGKETKLLFPYNMELKLYNPPFLKPCFVKLDSLMKLHKSEWKKFSILNKGNKLDESEMKKILSKILR